MENAARPAYLRWMLAVHRRAGSAVPPRGGRAARIAVVSAMTLASLNLWTGAPLLALWVGSRVQGGGPPTMGAVLVVVLCLGLAVAALTRLLAALESVHERLTGRPAAPRHHDAWLRSMSDEHEHELDRHLRLTALDRTLIGCVVLAVAAFELWFFLLAGSPFGH